MSAWLKRFGLHLAAAVGATGIFVAAAAVGASQTRQQVTASRPVVLSPPAPTARPKPAIDAPPAGAGNTTQRVLPERSLAGTVKAVQAAEIDVVGVGGREWHVAPAPGALIRRNGKPARLDEVQTGEGVVILGQAQPGQGARFLAHAITAHSR